MLDENTLPEKLEKLQRELAACDERGQLQPSDDFRSRVMADVHRELSLPSMRRVQSAQLIRWALVAASVMVACFLICTTIEHPTAPIVKPKRTIRRAFASTNGNERDTASLTWLDYRLALCESPEALERFLDKQVRTTAQSSSEPVLTAASIFKLQLSDVLTAPQEENE